MAESLIRSYLAAERLLAGYAPGAHPAWLETLYTASYEALVALATDGDEDALDFLLWKEI